MANVEVKDSGNLQDKQALKRFLELALSPFKGVMVFGRAKEKKSFIFDAGVPYFPNTLLSENVLGKLIFEKNLINADQFKKTKEIEASGKTFFEAITSPDILPKETVYGLILQQWQDDLSTIFMWESGQFASVEFMPKDMISIPLAKSLKHYVFAALVDKNKKIKNKFPPTMRFEINAAPENVTPGELGLSEIENKVYEALKQSKQIRGVGPEIGSTPEVVAPIILSLREIGLVRADSDPKKKAQAIVAPQVVEAVASDEFGKADEINILSKLKELDSINYYDLIGVKKDFNPQDLQKIYFNLAKKYHPDRIKMKMSIPVKDAERFFAKITEAYNTLSNPILRKEYEFNSSHEASEHEELMKRIVQSESVYLDGQSMLNRNLINEAVAKLREAVALYDQEPEYYITLGWALFRQGVKDKVVAKIAEGKKLLMDAYAREYNMALVSYYLGMIAKQEGKVTDAIKFLRMCISIEPNHALAMSELRFLEKKQDDKPGKKR
ncbi:MAG: DnaJ domain-containing protein [Proteobacteria bacterium]|jgi:curved DNA-binding protein CbpA|nr:DnaJ domain-containing protein [Pseudomonadota bacterium]